MIPIKIFSGWALDKEYKIDTATIDGNKDKKEVRETLKPILDVQDKPLINLQLVI